MSKRIYVVRHAKSSWADMSLSDKQRPLNSRGKQDAPRMAAWCMKHGYVPDVMISSSAVRAHETAKVFRKVLQLSKEQLHTTDSLYHAPPELYLEACYGLSEEVKSVMLFGHNPGITYLANEVSRTYIDNVATCGVLVIDSMAKSWTDVDFRNSNLAVFKMPKEL